MWLNTKVAVPPVTVLQKVKKTEVSIWLWHLTAWLRPVWVFPAPVKHQEKKPTIYKKSQICVPKKFCQNNIIIKAYPQIHQTHAMKKLDFSSLAYRAWIAHKTLIKLHNDAFFIWSFVLIWYHLYLLQYWLITSVGNLNIILFVLNLHNQILGN